jgi:protein arginine N-methyltransferase 1
MTDKRDQAELGQFIPLHYHYNMLNDTARMQGFKTALNYVVRPGDRVLELGGGTGVLSFFAAQKAGKVWCVERNPELAAAARESLGLNLNGDKVEVIEADAFEYLPPQPVDVVVCEMIHVAMLREKQIPVIASFKERYLKRFGGPLPAFVPEALIQAVQPIHQSFDFEGYHVPTILFQDSAALQSRTRELAQPAIYQMLPYQDELPRTCDWNGRITIDQAGTLNALRFITKNVLAIMVEEQRTVDWFSQYMIVPLVKPLAVEAGEQIQIHFSYEAGASFAALTSSLDVSQHTQPKFDICGVTRQGTHIKCGARTPEIA